MGQGSETRTSLVGKLEDLSLGEILQIVSLSQRSGVLRLSGQKGEAHIFILGGKIVHATLSTDTEGLFSFIVSRRLVDSARLEGLKDRLREGMDAQELSRLLAEAGVLPASFQQALKRRVEELVYSLFLWEEGSFSFELVDSKGKGQPFGANAFFLEEPINPQFLVMEGARRKDEANRGHFGAAGIVPADEEEGAPEEAEEAVPSSQEEDRAAQEVEEFTPPPVPPRLPSQTDRVVLLVLRSPHLRAFLKERLEGEKVTVIAFPDGATALTGIQDLRSRGIHPLLVIDLRAEGIADGLALGGLEILTTLWDLGYHLPAVLVGDGPIPVALPAKVSPVPGLSLVDVRSGGEEAGEASLVQAILSALGQGGGMRPPGEEFVDIRAELSTDLAEVDLPLDKWQGEEAPEAPSGAYEDPLMEKLRSYVGELSRPDAGGEITLLALRFAAECTGRALLFLARRGELKGLGQFGVDMGPGRDPNRAIQQLVVPLTPDSPFSRVIGSYQSFRGAPTGSAEEKAIFTAMGGAVPREIYVGPVISMGKVAVILYGDDSPEGKGLPGTHALDIFLSHVGLALDRAFLTMKLGSRRA